MSGQHCESYDVKRETVHCYPVNSSLLTAVARNGWNLSAVFKFCFCLVLLYNKSLNDWSLGEQSLSVYYCMIALICHIAKVNSPSCAIQGSDQNLAGTHQRLRDSMSGRAEVWFRSLTKENYKPRAEQEPRRPTRLTSSATASLPFRGQVTKADNCKL